MKPIYLLKPEDFSFWSRDKRDSQRDNKKKQTSIFVFANEREKQLRPLSFNQKIFSLSEFWLKCLYKTNSKPSLISFSSMEVLLWDWLKNEGAGVTFHSFFLKDVKNILFLIYQLLPVFSHPKGMELIKEYFFLSCLKGEKERKKRSLNSWVLWSEEAFQFWKFSLKKDIIIPLWIKGYLSYQNKWDQILWDEELVFDLGLSLTSFDADLIQELSRRNEVSISIPYPSWVSFYEKNLKPYSYLNLEKNSIKNGMKKKSSKEVLKENEEKLENILSFSSVAENLFKKPSLKLRRHISEFSEVKDALSHIKMWLNQSVSPKDIALLAPRVSDYEPTLSLYLEKEGLPYFCERKRIPFHSFPFIMKWISEIKIESGEVNFFDLESSFYCSSQYSPMNYDAFRHLFYPLLLEPKNASSSSSKPYLKFLSSFSSLMLKPKSEESSCESSNDKNSSQNGFFHHFNHALEGKSLSQREFFIWAFDKRRGRFVKTPFEENIFKLLERLFLKESLSSFSLPLKAWVYILEDICSRNSFSSSELFFPSKEKSSLKESYEIKSLQDKIYICDLAYGANLDSKYIYVLGLKDSQLRGKELRSLIPSQDLMRLSEELGFPVDIHSSLSHEFSLFWLMEKKFDELILSYPMTNFQGQVEVPSRAWIKGTQVLNRDFKTIDTPETAFSDESREIFLQRDLEINNTSAMETVKECIQRDKGEKEPEKFGRDLILKSSLDIRDIESYEYCPFIFAAEKLFKLKKPLHLQKEINPLMKHRFLSRLFKKLETEALEKKTLDKENLELEKESIDQDLMALIEACRIQEESHWIDERIWPVIKTKFKRFAKDFLVQKESWENQFSKPLLSKDFFTWEVFFDYEKAQFLNFSHKKTLKLKSNLSSVRGFYDKELKSYKYILVHFTMSSRLNTNYKSWTKNHFFHLPLSSYLIQEALTPLPQGQVIGAFYFNPLQGSLVRKGFFVESLVPFFNEGNKNERSKEEGSEKERSEREKSVKKKSERKIKMPSNLMSRLSFMTQDEQNAFYEENIYNLKVTLDSLLEGRMNPKPKNERSCERCSWKKICRVAPQLHLY